MQLLHASPIPAPQFASLSIVLQPTSTGDENDDVVVITMAEPLMTISPTATVHKTSVLQAMLELHGHVVAIHNSNDQKTKTTTTTLASELIREDDSRNMQIFRPLACNGIALHYKLIQQQQQNDSKLISLILSSAHQQQTNTATAITKIDPSIAVIGVLLTVGVTGLPVIHAAGSIQYSLEQRISDCISLLQKMNDVGQAKSILKTFLLDEERKTNEMVEAADTLVLLEPEGKHGGGALLSSPMMGSMISPIADFGRSKTSKQRGGAESSLLATFPLSLAAGSADAARTMTERLSVLSVAESDCHLKKYQQSYQERRANLDLHGGGGKSSSRFRRRKVDSARDADLDHFDYKGPVKKETTVPQHKAIPTLQPVAPEQPPPSGAKLQLKSSKKDTRKATRRLSNHMTTKSLVEDDEASQQTKNSFDPFAAGAAANSNNNNSKKKQTPPNHQFDDEISEATNSNNHENGSVFSNNSNGPSSSRIQVNIALNEDLTCSYKLSQLSSCSIEGVVQVQVKCPSRPVNIPFALLVRDPASHIDTVHENKKLVEKIAPNGEDADYKFNVTIPKQETYFPLLKYKCAGSLRPVPIRVQTKVKADGDNCRVALQISSNPNNDASLSDLTIVMGVPDSVNGETLVTHPSGGVWDKAKSSVVWCVSELGGGEKFQLQARFQTIDAAASSSDLNFPVLVRCQCLYVQLSDVEFEVKETDAYKAEVAMKVARSEEPTIVIQWMILMDHAWSHSYDTSARALMAATAVLKEFVNYLPSVMAHIMSYLTIMSKGLFICHGQGLMWGGIVSKDGRCRDAAYRRKVVAAFKKHCDDLLVVPYHVPVGGFMMLEQFMRLDNDLRKPSSAPWTKSTGSRLIFRSCLHSVRNRAIASASSIDLANVAAVNKKDISIESDLGNDKCVPYFHATRVCTSCSSFVCRDVRTRFLVNEQQ